jgi:hypothetical protein
MALPGVGTAPHVFGEMFKMNDEESDKPETPAFLVDIAKRWHDPIIPCWD